MIIERDKIYLTDIAESIEKIGKFLDTSGKSQFLQDELLQSAVVRQLEIIGEAASRVSQNQQKDASDIPWREVISMRNFVIHDYGRVDYEKVWNTIKKDLPVLEKQLQKILR